MPLSATETEDAVDAVVRDLAAERGDVVLPVAAQVKRLP